jgi:hypothetical protein
MVNISCSIAPLLSRASPRQLLTRKATIS